MDQHVTVKFLTKFGKSTIGTDGSLRSVYHVSRGSPNLKRKGKRLEIIYTQVILAHQKQIDTNIEKVSETVKKKSSSEQLMN